MENITHDQIMSYNINELATALAKAQGEFTTAKKDKDNPFFKSSYADLESIIAASRPALAKHGLSVVQSPFFENGSSFLITVLLHSSGQWIKSKAQHNPQKTDVQSLSSYNTYLKRMCYASLLGVSTSNEDDDGQQASHQQAKPVYKITQQQIMHLGKILNFLKEDVLIQVVEKFNIDKLDQLTLSQYNDILAYIDTK